MPIQCTAQDRTLVAALAGEIDHHSAKALMTDLDQKIAAALPRRLTLDLSGVTFMDSSGIAVVIRAHRRMTELGGRLTIRSVPAQPMKVLHAANLERMMEFE